MFNTIKKKEGRGERRSLGSNPPSTFLQLPHYHNLTYPLNHLSNPSNPQFPNGSIQQPSQPNSQSPVPALDSGTQFSSVAQSCLTLWPHESQHARPPRPSPTPGAYSNSCLLSQWCHPTILSSVVPFSSHLQSLPASGSFPMSQFFTSGGQSTGVSASTSVLPLNIQDWSPLGWTGWISSQAKGLSRVFSNTIVQKHQFFGAQLSL